MVYRPTMGGADHNTAVETMRRVAANCEGQQAKGMLFGRRVFVYSLAKSH